MSIISMVYYLGYTMMFVLEEKRRSSINETNSRNKPWIYVVNSTGKLLLYILINDAKILHIESGLGVRKSLTTYILQQMFLKF